MAEQNKNVALELEMPKGILETAAESYSKRLFSRLNKDDAMQKIYEWRSDNEPRFFKLGRQVLLGQAGEITDEAQLGAVMRSGRFVGACSSDVLAHSVVGQLKPDTEHLPSVVAIDEEIRTYPLISAETYVMSHPTLDRLAHMAAFKAWPEDDSVHKSCRLFACYLLLKAEEQACQIVEDELMLEDMVIEQYADALLYSSLPE